MAWSNALQKCIIHHFLLDKFFLQTFLLYNWILQKNSIFANFLIFLQMIKVEHKNFPMMCHLSYLDISVSWFSSSPAGIGLRMGKEEYISNMNCREIYIKEEL